MAPESLVRERLVSGTYVAHVRKVPVFVAASSSAC